MTHKVVKYGRVNRVYHSEVLWYYRQKTIFNTDRAHMISVSIKKGGIDSVLVLRKVEKCCRKLNIY